jgi:hypothetical protein
MLGPAAWSRTEQAQSSPHRGRAGLQAWGRQTAAQDARKYSRSCISLLMFIFMSIKTIGGDQVAGLLPVDVCLVASMCKQGAAMEQCMHQ